MYNIYTDLAIESKELYDEGNDKEIEGVSVEVEEKESYSVTRVEVLNKSGMEMMKNPLEGI